MWLCRSFLGSFAGACSGIGVRVGSPGLETGEVKETEVEERQQDRDVPSPDEADAVDVRATAVFPARLLPPSPGWIKIFKFLHGFRLELHP
uniref:Secreted protein n=1 Tax=Setaria viridis TaxID=4556 RepID=A0A4U6WK00_SETVI|nr:hypothetical protein SEVIR_1G375850v2 [Setaria viridis]